MRQPTLPNKKNVVMSDPWLLLALLLVLAVLYLQLADQRKPDCRKRRPPTSAEGVSAPAAGLLARVKWSTISRMLCWRAEMNKLDNLLETVTASAAANSSPTAIP